MDDTAGGLRPIDPTGYRVFGITGQLVAAGQVIPVSRSAHANDLPEGDAGKDEIATRVLRALAQEYADPDATWQHVEVTEFGRPSAMYEGQLPQSGVARSSP